MDEKIISNAEELATAVVMQDAAKIALMSFSLCIPAITQLAKQMSEKPPIGENLRFDFAYKKWEEHYDDIAKRIAKEIDWKDLIEREIIYTSALENWRKHLTNIRKQKEHDTKEI